MLTEKKKSPDTSSGEFFFPTLQSDVFKVSSENSYLLFFFFPFNQI